jgi:hypothetical protein
MKKVLLLSLFLTFIVFCHAQDAGRVVIVRVVEIYGVGPIKSSINIITSGGVETIELDKTRRVDGPEQIENDKKVRAALDKVEGNGYVLKTSNVSGVGPDNAVLSTTYVFEKK